MSKRKDIAVFVLTAGLGFSSRRIPGLFPLIDAYRGGDAD
jgi:hypothetical protein